MKLRFKTKDNLICVKDCPEITEPVSVIRQPMWNGVAVPGMSNLGLPHPDFIQYRKYQFRGEVVDGMPTVVECD